MTPTIQEYEPLKAQLELHNFCRSSKTNWNGVQEILLSGSVASSKTLGMSHEIIMQAISNKKAHIGIGRKDSPALKDTILKSVLDHMGTDVSYSYNKTRSIIELPNKSMFTCLSWGDGDFKRFRSYEFDIFAIEELTENDKGDFYYELIQRIGRNSKFKRPFVVCATNPDGPSHWAYKHFIATGNPNRKVIYSRTHDNIHIPESYITNLKATLTEKEIRRQLYGEWIEINREVVYYAYERDKNFVPNNYEFNPVLPVDIYFDFNIGEGKPMSAGCGQYSGDTYHLAKDFIVPGARTLDICQELSDYLKTKQFTKIRIFGDATGRARDTRNNQTDYDIILKFFQNNFNCPVEIHVPKANPAIRNRHNTVNGMICNSFKKIRLKVYKEAPTTDEGFRLTQFKKNSQIEDDSKYWQHITTAIGYYVMEHQRMINTLTGRL